MKNKTKYILCAILGIIIFAIGIFSTVTAIKNANEFKVYNKKYAIMYNTDKLFNEGKISANTQAAKDKAHSYSKEFKKYFAISFLLYFADVMMVAFLYLDYTKKKQIETQKE